MKGFPTRLHYAQSGRQAMTYQPRTKDTVKPAANSKYRAQNGEAPKVIISAFADEAANSKSVVEQFAVLAALGLEYYSPRFLNVTGETKNIMKLDKAELKTVKSMQDDYGLKVTSIGSPI